MGALPRTSAPAGCTPLRRLLRLRVDWRAGGHSVVFTNGVFDLLHIGHVTLLGSARRLGDVLVVGVNGDDSVRALKGPTRPIVPEAERAAVVAALRDVDHVIVFHDPTAVPLLAALRPDVYVKGADYARCASADGATKPLPEASTVDTYGGGVHLLPLVAGHSTSDMIYRIVRLSSPPRPDRAMRPAPPP